MGFGTQRKTGALPGRCCASWTPPPGPTVTPCRRRRSGRRAGAGRRCPSAAHSTAAGWSPPGRLSPLPDNTQCPQSARDGFLERFFQRFKHQRPPAPRAFQQVIFHPDSHSSFVTLSSVLFLCRPLDQPAPATLPPSLWKLFMIYLYGKF